MLADILIHDPRPVVVLHLRSTTGTSQYNTVDQPDWGKNCDVIEPYYEQRGEGDEVWFRIKRDGVVTARVNSFDVTLVEYVSGSQYMKTPGGFIQFPSSSSTPAAPEGPEAA